MNLRTRFALITGGIVLVLATVMSFGAYSIASNQLENQVQSALEQRAARILSIASQDGFRWIDAFGRGPVNRAIMETEIDAITQVVLPDGRVYGRNENPLLPITDREKNLLSSNKPTMISTTQVGGHEYRVLTVAAPDGSLIQVAKDTQILVNARTGMRTWLPLYASLAVVIAALIGWWFAGRIARPIQDLASTAESIAETQDLDNTISVSGADEVGKLATSFNTMLEALRGSVARQRQLVQDASHELRTPLTSLRANTELLERATLTDEDRASILSDMRAEIDELTALSAELNALATDQRKAEEITSVDLSEVAHEIVARASRRTSAPLSVHVTSDVIVQARPSQLERALSNLVDNAVKFSNGESEVEIHVGAKRVEVRDHGPGISDFDKPHVFDRFYRAVATRSMPGSGLGLAIVAQFVQDHNANAYVLDNVGGGAIVGIQFTA